MVGIPSFLLLAVSKCLLCIYATLALLLKFLPVGHVLHASNHVERQVTYFIMHCLKFVLRASQWFLLVL